jgi:hypothetical protein
MTKLIKDFVIASPVRSSCPTEEESLFVAHFCCSHSLLNSFRFLVPRNDKIHEELCHCFASSFLVSDGGGISVCCSRLLLFFVTHICCSTSLDSSFLGMTKSLMSFVIASPVRSSCPKEEESL